MDYSRKKDWELHKRSNTSARQDAYKDQKMVLHLCCDDEDYEPVDTRDQSAKNDEQSRNGCCATRVLQQELPKNTKRPQHTEDDQ